MRNNLMSELKTEAGLPKSFSGFWISDVSSPYPTKPGEKLNTETKYNNQNEEEIMDSSKLKNKHENLAGKPSTCLHYDVTPSAHEETYSPKQNEDIDGHACFQIPPPHQFVIPEHAHTYVVHAPPLIYPECYTTAIKCQQIVHSPPQFHSINTGGLVSSDSDLLELKHAVVGENALAHQVDEHNNTASSHVHMLTSTSHLSQHDTRSEHHEHNAVFPETLSKNVDKGKGNEKLQQDSSEAEIGIIPLKAEKKIELPNVVQVSHATLSSTFEKPLLEAKKLSVPLLNSPNDIGLVKVSTRSPPYHVVESVFHKSEVPASCCSKSLCCRPQEASGKITQAKAYIPSEFKYRFPRNRMPQHKTYEVLAWEADPSIARRVLLPPKKPRKHNFFLGRSLRSRKAPAFDEVNRNNEQRETAQPRNPSPVSVEPSIFTRRETPVEDSSCSSCNFCSGCCRKKNKKRSEPKFLTEMISYVVEPDYKIKKAIKSEAAQKIVEKRQKEALKQKSKDTMKHERLELVAIEEQEKLKQEVIEDQKCLYQKAVKERQRLEKAALEREAELEQRQDLERTVMEQELFKKEALEQERKQSLQATMEEESGQPEALMRKREEQEQLVRHRLEQRSEEQCLEQQRLKEICSQRLEQQHLEKQQLEEQSLDQQLLEQKSLKEQQSEQQRLEQEYLKQNQFAEELKQQRLYDEHLRICSELRERQVYLEDCLMQQKYRYEEVTKKLIQQQQEYEEVATELRRHQKERKNAAEKLKKECSALCDQNEELFREKFRLYNSLKNIQEQLRLHVNYLYQFKHHEAFQDSEEICSLLRNFCVNAAGVLRKNAEGITDELPDIQLIETPAVQRKRILEGRANKMEKEQKEKQSKDKLEKSCKERGKKEKEKKAPVKDQKLNKTNKGNKKKAETVELDVDENYKHKYKSKSRKSKSSSQEEIESKIKNKKSQTDNRNDVKKKSKYEQKLSITLGQGSHSQIVRNKSKNNLQEKSTTEQEKKPPLRLILFPQCQAQHSENEITASKEKYPEAVDEFRYLKQPYHFIVKASQSPEVSISSPSTFSELQHQFKSQEINFNMPNAVTSKQISETKQNTWCYPSISKINADSQNWNNDQFVKKSFQSECLVVQLQHRSVNDDQSQHLANSQLMQRVSVPKREENTTAYIKNYILPKQSKTITKPSTVGKTVLIVKNSLSTATNGKLNAEENALGRLEELGKQNFSEKSAMTVKLASPLNETETKSDTLNSKTSEKTVVPSSNETSLLLTNKLLPLTSATKESFTVKAADEKPAWSLPTKKFAVIAKKPAEKDKIEYGFSFQEVVEKAAPQILTKKTGSTRTEKSKSLISVTKDEAEDESTVQEVKKKAALQHPTEKAGLMIIKKLSPLPPVAKEKTEDNSTVKEIDEKTASQLLTKKAGFMIAKKSVSSMSPLKDEAEDRSTVQELNEEAALPHPTEKPGLMIIKKSSPLPPVAKEKTEDGSTVKEVDKKTASQILTEKAGFMIAKKSASSTSPLKDEAEDKSTVQELNEEAALPHPTEKPGLMLIKKLSSPTPVAKEKSEDSSTVKEINEKSAPQLLSKKLIVKKPSPFTPPLEHEPGPSP